MDNLRGGILTFYNNFNSDPRTSKLMDSTSLYLASKKKPLGNGKKNFIRIDGVYFHKFSSNNKANYFLNNYLLNRGIINNYNKCEKIIFQSKFSKEMFLKIVKPKSIKESIIIYNGCKEILEYPHSFNKNKKLKIITCSVDHPTKRLHYFFELEKKLKLQNIDFEITIITNLIDLKQRLLSKMKSFDNYFVKDSKIKILRNLSKTQVVTHLLNSNLYVSFSHIDPCPNSIIEAISVGLPIIAPNSGSMHELCLNDLLYNKQINRDFLNLFQYEKVDNLEVIKVSEKIELFMSNSSFFYENSIKYKKRFILEDMIDQYITFMK